MKANITFDKDNYILSLNTGDGEYDLPEDFDFSKAFYYHLVNDELVLDTVKAEEGEIADEKRSRIEMLTYQLQMTNSDMLDFIEQLFSFKNPLTFISDMFTLMKNYTALVTERQNIRKQIKELQK